MRRCSRWTSTISGAIIAPGGKLAKSPGKPASSGWRRSQWSGGVYSSEWGFSKLLHWLRHNPEARVRFGSAFEHCDYIAAVLCGIRDPAKVRRSICAMGHKWMWNKALGGLPPEEFLVAVDPLLAGVREKLGGEYQTSDAIAGTLTAEWAEKLGLQPGVPIPVGAFDAHWDAVAAGAQLGDMVNVIGTSTCIIGLSDKTTLVPGVCGIVPGSVDPKLTGIEAGPFGGWRYLRCDRAPRRYHRSRLIEGDRRLPQRPDRAAAPHLG